MYSFRTIKDPNSVTASTDAPQIESFNAQFNNVHYYVPIGGDSTAGPSSFGLFKREKLLYALGPDAKVRETYTLGQVNVTDPIGVCPQDDQSSGGIVGIVVGVLAVFLIVGGLVYRSNKKEGSVKNKAFTTIA